MYEIRVSVWMSCEVELLLSAYAYGISFEKYAISFPFCFYGLIVMVDFIIFYGSKFCV